LMLVSEMTVKLAAAVSPKVTAVVPVNPLPVMVTSVPPPVVPEVGDSEVTAGTAGAE
jgi:hypothetical protein